MKTKKDIRKQVYLNKLSHKTVKRGIEHADCEAKKHIIVLSHKLANKIARNQSKEDKAKYRASLVAFKETYVRTYKVQENYMLDADKKHSKKKNRGFARKSTAKIYKMKKVMLAT